MGELLRCPPSRVIDPREDDALINHFPNLITRPEDPTVRKAFEEQNSIIAGESTRFRELIAHLALARHRVRKRCAGTSDQCEQELREAGWKALQEYYSDSYDLTPEHFARDRTIFSASLNAARETIEHVIDEYFPVRLRFGLYMSSEIGGEHDPVRLVRRCAKPGSDIISRIRRFEARRQLTLAQIEFERRLNHASPEKLDEDLVRFIRTCEERFFIPHKSDQVTVIAELDPNRAHRVSEFRIVSRKSPEARVVPTPQLMVLPLDVRFIRGKGRDIPVYFDARVKQHVALKLIRKRSRRETLTDELGAKFVFFDEEHDLMEGVEHLRRTLVRAPGTVSGEASNAKRAGVLDPKNTHSSAEYRARKYDVCFWRRIFEISFMYIPFYVNELVAHGQDNHPLYKLVSNLDLVFPVIFPTELYGLDWRDENLRQELWDFQLAKI